MRHVLRTRTHRGDDAVLCGLSPRRGELIEHGALIIGGGLAGSMLAIKLAAAGRDVILLEKSKGPHDKVCGEFFSREALHYLRGIGLDLQTLGAVSITGVRIAGKEVFAEAPLPFPALSLTRRKVDEAMLQLAREAGASVLRGQNVLKLEKTNSTWIARDSSGEQIRAPSVFLATGKHDLHGWPRGRGWQTELIAFKMYFKLAPDQGRALANHVELILFPDGYAGLQPVEDGKANLCLLVTRARLQQCGSCWARLLDGMCRASEHLARRLEGAQPALERPLALSSIPYGYIASSAPDGVWRLGDQGAVIPSFSGDGMSIALHSASLAAALYLGGDSPQTFSMRLARDLKPGIQLATALSHLMIRLPRVAHLACWRSTLLRDVALATRIPEDALLRDGLRNAT